MKKLGYTKRKSVRGGKCSGVKGEIVYARNSFNFEMLKIPLFTR